MDLYKAINELLEEKHRLDEVIARMELLLVTRHDAKLAATNSMPLEMPVLRKRGRKGMSEEERLEVSKRMKDYWAKRRKAKAS